MKEKLEKIGSLRKSLEPLAVLYKKAVLEPGKEPFEVHLSTRLSPDYLGDALQAEDTVHIIDAESLKAVYEVWQEYCQVEQELLKLNGNAISIESESDPAADELAYLSAAEREWLEWFYHLSDEDRRIVEDCGEQEVSVTPSNFDQVKDMLEQRDAATWDTVVRLFKS